MTKSNRWLLFFVVVWLLFAGAYVALAGEPGVSERPYIMERTRVPAPLSLPEIRREEVPSIDMESYRAWKQWQSDQVRQQQQEQLDRERLVVQQENERRRYADQQAREQERYRDQQMREEQRQMDQQLREQQRYADQQAREQERYRSQQIRDSYRYQYSQYGYSGGGYGSDYYPLYAAPIVPQPLYDPRYRPQHRGYGQYDHGCGGGPRFGIHLGF